MAEDKRTPHVSLPCIEVSHSHRSKAPFNASENIPPPPPDCPHPACHMDSIEQVEHAKQEWESTADSMPQLICLVDESGHILRANRTVERWGLGNVADVRGLTMHALLHPNCHRGNCVQKNFWETALEKVEEGKPVEFQTEDYALQRHLHLSFQSHQAPKAAAGTAPSRFGVAIVGDISELKQAEKKLQQLNSELEDRVEARTFGLVCANLLLKQEIDDRKAIELDLEKSRGDYLRLVETMSEGLMACNNECMVTYVNDRFCEMVKRARKDIIGHSATEFIETSNLDLWDQLTTNLKTGTTTFEELKLAGPKGHELWVKVSPSQMINRDGKVEGYLAVITDISDRIISEQVLRASKNQLSQLSEQVMAAQEKERQRVAGELHDGIGQTLSAVKFSVETGIKRLYDHPSEDAIHQLENIIPRIQSAIEEVRRISMALRPSMLDDIGILATLTWFCRESALVYGNLQIQLQQDIEEESIPALIKVVIFRIVQEAFNNTVKHSHAKNVRISLKRTDDAVELDIEDNGSGFTVKKRAGKSSSGLGLISMRERAESSGGVYFMDSTKGKGSRIHVTWPLTEFRNPEPIIP